MGHYWLPPYLKKFKEEYPAILLDIDIRTGYTDLTKREADIVVSAVNQHPDYMVGKILAPIELVLYASREYVEKWGRPKVPQDLAAHRLLILNEELREIGFNEWLKNLVPKSAISVSCNMLTSLYRYAREGLGIAPLPNYVGEQDSNLVRIMDVPKRFYPDIWILTHPDLKNTQRIKAFMRFMYSETKK